MTDTPKATPSKIIRCWESPTNEGTEIYVVGSVVKKWRTAAAEEWSVGRIKFSVSRFRYEGMNAIALEPNRIEIYDTDNNLRVTLPASACGVEWEPADD